MYLLLFNFSLQIKSLYNWQTIFTILIDKGDTSFLNRSETTVKDPPLKIWNSKVLTILMEI